MKNLQLLPVLFSLMLVAILFFFSSILLDSKSPLQPELKAFCGVPDLDNVTFLGKKRFLQISATCHSSDMKTPATGPALGGSLVRWNQDTMAIYAYLFNPQIFMEENENHFIVQMRKEHRGFEKPPHPHLDYPEVKAVLAYIEYVHLNNSW